MMLAEGLIRRADFLAYETVRRSGSTNMNNIGIVSALSGLEKAKVIEIIRNYRKLKEKWGT